MKSFVRLWSFWVEFCLVMAVAFGPFIYAAWHMMPHGGRAKVNFDDTELLSTALAEAALGLGLAVFLKMRGYTRADFPFHLAPRAWGQGPWLLITTYAIVMLSMATANSLLGPESFTASMMKVTLSVSFPTVLFANLVNALYEELFVTGYILRTLEKPHGTETAVVFSVLVRFLYHVYQGPQAIFTVIPIGFIFALYFARTRNLWPLVLAHALIDIVSFSFAPR